MDFIESAEAALGFGSPPAAPAAATTAAMAAATDTQAVTAAPAGPLDSLADAIRAVAPHADADAWVAAFTAPMRSSGISTPRRIAAFLGQVAVESGGLTTLSENDNFTHAALLLKDYPHAFSSLKEAEGYAGQPERIANRVYAGELGNGDEASGDGWAFRGRGAIQLTGRTAHESFAKAMGRDLAGCPDWCATPAGAAASACWFWSTRGGMNALADAWAISAITAKVNGPAKLGNAERISLSNAALAALNAAAPTS
jgi:putative chitinase